MYDLHTICKTANILVHSMSRSQAFQTAWSMAKSRIIEKVSGVRFGRRQAAISHLMMYPEDAIRFHLIRESGNQYDKNAVAVAAEIVGLGQYKMGYLPATTAALLAPIMDRGINLRAALKSIVGGAGGGLSYGLRLQVAI